MAANAVGLAGAKVGAALLTHTMRPRNSHLHRHRKVLGNFFNASQVQ